MRGCGHCHEAAVRGVVTVILRASSMFLCWASLLSP